MSALHRRPVSGSGAFRTGNILEFGDGGAVLQSRGQTGRPCSRQTGSRKPSEEKCHIFEQTIPSNAINSVKKKES